MQLSRRILILAVSSVLAACGDQTQPTVPRNSGTAVLSPNLTGTLQIVWGDPRDPRGEAGRVTAFVTGANGRMTQVVMGDGSEPAMRRLIALNSQRVNVMGGAEPGSDASLNPVFRAASVQAANASAVQAAQLGNKRYLAILCKFPDYDVTFGDTRTKAVYQQWMGVGAVTPAYPSINHYWREQSRGLMNFDNSTVVGWYTMPHQRVYYLGDHGGGDTTKANLGDLVRDCTGVADADVNFNDYTGIVVQFNANLDCCSWGGGWTLNLDGVNKTRPTAWMAHWAHQSVYAHESGHSLGLPHSSGPYGDVYDSDWDVMSNTYQASAWNAGYNTYVGQGTIAFHKDLLGWIPAERKVNVGWNSRQTVFLDRLTPPAGGNSTLVATVNLSSTERYTVEARKLAGYDVVLPTKAVIINNVVTWRSEPAHLMDATMNQDPHDDGVQWQPGETFVDATNDVRISVNGKNADGFGVTLSYGNYHNSWSRQRSLPLVRSVANGVAFGKTFYVFGGLKNGSTVLDRTDAYDTRTDLWEKVKNMPAPRYLAMAATVGDYIYVVGGANASFHLTNTLYRYNPRTDTWATRAPMPIPNGGCGGAVSKSGRLYVFIGCTSTSSNTALMLRYDPDLNSWSTLAPSPRVHAKPVVGIIDGMIYVAGGFGPSNSILKYVDIYDVKRDRWTRGPSMPDTRGGAAGGVLNGKLYVVGGSSPILLKPTWVFNPVSGSWASRAGIPLGREFPAAAFVDNALHVAGGHSTTGYLSTHHVFYP